MAARAGGALLPPASLQHAAKANMFRFGDGRHEDVRDWNQLGRMVTTAANGGNICGWKVYIPAGTANLCLQDLELKKLWYVRRLAHGKDVTDCIAWEKASERTEDDDHTSDA